MPARPNPAFAPTDAPRAGTILAIDHNRDHLAALGRRLADRGYRIVLSDHGPEALALIAARGFDLVLLGTTTPDHAGLHILRELRGSRATADLPVIVLTGRSDPAAAVAALAAGADDHVAKPFDSDVLAARIARVLARARRIADLQRANAALDARIATRAVELGEANSALAATRADQLRLIASIRALNAELERLSETSAAR
jgi:DNA-binding response OmpR family regulator